MPFIVLTTMSSSEKAAGTSIFSETGVNVEEGELDIDERVTERKVSLDSPFVPNLVLAEREREKEREREREREGGREGERERRRGVCEECVRRALEQLGGEFSVGTDSVCDADDEGQERFVGVVGK